MSMLLCMMIICMHYCYGNNFARKNRDELDDRAYYTDYLRGRHILGVI